MARSLAAASAGALTIVAAATVHAQQIDVNPPLPNVLLMIDNSGSMERMIDGNIPEAEGNACNVSGCTVSGSTTTCSTWGTAPASNRWNTLVTALTGSMASGGPPSCIAMPRSAGSDFANEYEIAGVAPYDTGYYLNYHRIVALDTTTHSGQNTPCVVAPGSLPGATNGAGVGPSGFGSGGNPVGSGGSALDFPGSAIITRPYGQFTVNSNTCNFAQNPDGTLDSDVNLMRFALMTFDQDPDPSIGVSTSTPQSVLSPAFTGMWSYFPGWNGGGGVPSPAWGKPVNCQTSPPPPFFEVGARNPAAPPWEGRMIMFPSDNQDTTRQTQNANLQNTLLATRPYGATPIAGMFADAKYYLWTDPAGPNGSASGTATDPYVQGGCRPEYIILLTDGAPNLDMQPACSATGGTPGVCPYPLPETTAATLYNNGVAQGSLQFVKTYVIGFAVSSFNDGSQLIQCSTLSSTSSQCTNPTALYAPCCELQKIAVAGGTQHAFFADTPGDLQKALKAILDDIAKNSTTRTTPAFSASVASVVYNSSTPTTSTAIYNASLNPSPGQPWSGDVQRQRYQCTGSGTSPTGTAAQAIDPTQGDDFAANLNSNTGTRMFEAIQPTVPSPYFTTTNKPDPTGIIRPYYTKTTGGDGILPYSGTVYVDNATNVAQAITPASLVLPAGTNSCQYMSNNGQGSKYLYDTQCSTMLLDFTFGVQSFSGPSNFTFTSRYGNAFGDVYHATPAVVGPPQSLVQDDSYDAFRIAQASRHQDLYVATNDGLLHAFNTAVTSQTNNEEWAFLPPAVMPQLVSSYPATDKFLLDGSPIVKDVVWDRSLSTLQAASNWHTTLVASFGPLQRGYYAVDVTNPTVTGGATSGIPSTTSIVPINGGPVFLWQMVNMPSTNYQIFGAHSATPAITTLFMNPDGNGAREIGVAILPGGQETAPTTPSLATGCQRVSVSTHPADSAPPATASPPYAARTNVQCWGKNGVWTDPVIGRSVAIVRLDTGEIVRVFMRSNMTARDLNTATDTLYLANRVTDAPFDSPMTGVPIVYPSDVGSDATKAFIGDADGTIWKLDLSSTDPSAWTATLFLDLYNQTVDRNSTAWSDGQPLVVPPVLSLNNDGTVVVNAATGTQDSFDTTGLEYIYSIGERISSLDTSQLRAQVNWWMASSTPTVSGMMAQGERVSGPMTVFDGTLYFATYAASTGGPSCSGGDARVWGRDFAIPADPGCSNPLATSCDRSLGGIKRLPGPTSTSTLAFVEATDYGAKQGAVVPGVTILATNPCAAVTASTSDQYAFGQNRIGLQGSSAPSFSLFAPVASKGSGSSATGSINIPLPTPLAPTVIDSWAAVTE